jgi:hypothetical protein
VYTCVSVLLLPPRMDQSVPPPTPLPLTRSPSPHPASHGRAGRELGSATLVSSGRVCPASVASLADLPEDARGAGDDVVIFSGVAKACQAVNLSPHRLYGFRIVHSNGFGDSQPSALT